jgi:hypothetical protein
MRVSNSLWQRGQLMRRFPFARGIWIKALQRGQVRKRNVLTCLILRSNRENRFLTGFVRDRNFSFSRRRFSIFFEKDLKIDQSMNIHRTMLKMGDLKKAPTTINTRHRTFEALYSSSAPYLPVMKRASAYLILFIPKTP